MNKFTQSISRVVTGGVKAFSRYPVAMFFALVLATTASIRVSAEYGLNEKMFNSLQVTSAMGAFLGMAATALAVTVSRKSLSFILSQTGAFLLAAGTFLILYLPVGQIPSIALARVAAGTAVSLLLFLLLLSKKSTGLTYGGMSFVAIRSTAIAALYTLVLLGGLNFLAFTVKFLVFEGLSGDVYAHVSIWSALAGYAFFLGYFPDFRQALPLADSRAETIRKHPVFFEVLMAYVVIPIIAALSVVLLIWSVNILIRGEWPDFNQLTAIFSTYAIVGVVVAVLTGHYTQSTAIWFRKLFPIAALVFLAFEVYAVVDRIGRIGLGMLEYTVVLLTMYAVVAVLLLLLRPITRDRLTGWVAVAVIVLSVLPLVGFLDLPAWAQGAKLKKVLYRNEMLVDEQIRPVSGMITDRDMEIITDTAEHLKDTESALVPDWFESSYPITVRFETVFGFEPVRGGFSSDRPYETNNIYLQLPEGAVSLAGYDHAVAYAGYNEDNSIGFPGKAGTYTIAVRGMGGGDTPEIEVSLDDNELFSRELTGWVEDLAARYASSDTGKTGEEDIPYEDLVYRTEEAGIRLMIVFEHIEIYYDGEGAKPMYSLVPSAFYLGE